MDAPKVTASFHPARWTEAELNAWIDANAKPYYSEAAKIELGLFRWIEVATNNLDPAAAGQVRDDIRRQVNQETQRLQAEGCPEEAALRQAIASLGAPRQAGKVYEHHYLTRVEANRIEQLSRFTSIGTIWSIFWVFWLLYCIIFNWSDNSYTLFLLLSSFNLSDSAKGVVGRLLHISFTQILKRGMWVDLCIQIAMIVSFVLQNRHHPLALNSLYSVVLVVMLLLCVVGIVEQFRGTTRLIRKLERGAV